MVLFKYIVIVTMVSSCYSAEVRSGRYADIQADIQKIFDILKTQDEKINRLQTLAVTNQILPKCVAFLKNGNRLLSTKCWKTLINEIRVGDPSTTTEIKLLGQLVAEAYDGEQSRLPKLAEFIRDIAEKGSELANGGYEALVTAIDDYGRLYLKKNGTELNSAPSLVDYIYRTLNTIRKAEGDASPVFTALLPSAVNSIFSGKEVFIRNSVTKDFLYTPIGQNTKVLVGTVSGNDDPRYYWKFKPVELGSDSRHEMFYIENENERKILSMNGDDGSLELVTATEEKLGSTWSMFYVRLVEGSSGEEVAIQGGYWGLKTIGLNDDKKKPKLLSALSADTLNEIPTAIWLLQPKEK